LFDLRLICGRAHLILAENIAEADSFASFSRPSLQTRIFAALEIKAGALRKTDEISRFAFE
jgi:hypothetical protein